MQKALFPGYTVGPDAYEDIVNICPAYGKRAAIIGGKHALAAAEDKIRQAVEGSGMVLTGTVRNVIDFGAFVDIGVHQDGLVHISQISSKFIKHPSEVLTVGDVVKVVVLDVDEKKNRIGLSIKQAKDRE